MGLQTAQQAALAGRRAAWDATVSLCPVAASSKFNGKTLYGSVVTIFDGSAVENTADG